MIHHGVSPEFTPGPPEPDGDAPYLSAVGEFSARKGFGEAFAVVAALADAGYPHRLKVAGNVPPWVRADFERLVRSAPRPERIDALGFVPTHGLGAALTMVRGWTDRPPRVGFLLSPPYFPLRVNAK